jgi:hypothetical protein
MIVQTIRSTVLALALVLAAAAASCGGDPGEQTELTRAQKDSLVADMPIPGASGVAGAMQARDRANARAADHDSIGNERP